MVQPWARETPPYWSHLILLQHHGPWRLIWFLTSYNLRPYPGSSSPGQCLELLPGFSSPMSSLSTLHKMLSPSSPVVLLGMTINNPKSCTICFSQVYFLLDFKIENNYDTFELLHICLGGSSGGWPPQLRNHQEFAATQVLRLAITRMIPSRPCRPSLPDQSLLGSWEGWPKLLRTSPTLTT